jgi:hypothetical protein
MIIFENINGFTILCGIICMISIAIIMTVAVSREHQYLIIEETLVVISQRYEARVSSDNSPTKVTFLQVGVIIEFVEEKMCVIECKADTMSSSVGDP